MKDQLFCSVCKTKINKNNFWAHKHDDYKWGTIKDWDDGNEN
jgi:hypothetical protein